MTLRFLVDESTGDAVANMLRQHGFDVLSVSKVLPQADDTVILQFAVIDERIVITNDKDFGEMVYRDHLSQRGIVLLRLLDTSAANKQRVALTVIHRYGEQLIDAFCVATEQRSRLR